jgi:hypothetical protein
VQACAARVCAASMASYRQSQKCIFVLSIASPYLYTAHIHKLENKPQTAAKNKVIKPQVQLILLIHQFTSTLQK